MEHTDTLTSVWTRRDAVALAALLSVITSAFFWLVS